MTSRELSKIVDIMALTWNEAYKAGMHGKYKPDKPTQNTTGWEDNRKHRDETINMLISVSGLRVDN